jgi:hypothetical protein
MTTTSLRSVRYAFTMFLLALTVFAVAESAFGGRTARTAAVAAAPEGLSACGEAAPCVLPVVEVRAEASTGRLASTERAVGMTLRVRS